MLRISLIGFGGVGKAFMELLYNKEAFLRKEGLSLQINYILGSKGGIYDPKGIDHRKLFSYLKDGQYIADYPYGGSSDINFETMMRNGDIDIMVEMTPTNKETGEPGLTHIRRALKAGIHVITANKGPILLRYKELNLLAAENNVQLGIGCTTGGALPSVNGGLMDMAGAEILSIEGVLNGTTNYILKLMEEKGITYGDALKAAQAEGIAETNPSLDVDGWDTAIKMLILTNVLMNEEKTLKDVTVEGITGLTPEQVMDAKSKGIRYKLVGRTEKVEDIITISVKPELLEAAHPLYGIDGKNKAVRYTSDTLGDLTLIGGASGVVTAAASILRDLINISRGYKFSRIEI